MSLMKTLGKVAIGIMVAKGVGKMLGGGRGGSPKTGSDGGLGGGLGDLLGGLKGNGSQSRNPTGAELEDILGGITGKSGGGGLGGVLDSLNQGSNDNGIGDMLNDALQGRNVNVNDDQEDQAKVLLKAMISAAKADGNIDEEEQRKITEHLGDISPEEARFVRTEISTPLDTQGLIRSVPRGMEQQVYFMSLLAIDLDSNAEAHYLDELAKGLNISKDICNQIHAKVGAPALYA